MLRAFTVRAVRWGIRAAAVVLGTAQALAHRFEMNADGIAYLDAGDAWARGDWSQAINAYWSPMYSWLLSAVTAFGPPAVESSLAHVANLLALTLAMLGFEFFWQEIAKGEDTSTEDPVRATRDVSAGVVALWAFLFLVGVILLTPDMLVAGFALIAFGLLQRVTRETSVGTSAALGLVLGAGYYAKSAMFPVALMTLVCVFLAAWRRRSGLRPPLVAAGAFTVIAAPLVIALSVQKNRLTFGDSGRINYAFYVNAVPGVSHWRGGPPGAGEPVHPTRVITDDPYAYEFATPVGGTYPPWYDPSYWYEGVRPHPDLASHIHLARQHAPLVWSLLWPALAALSIVLAIGGAARRTLTELAARWPAPLVAVGGLTMYALVYLEERYVAAFVLTIALWILASLRAMSSRQWAIPLACLVLVVPAVRSLYGRADRDLFDTTMIIRGVYNEDNTPWRIAESLKAAGVPEGARIAMIGTGTHAYWARLANLRVVAEVPHLEVLRFWRKGRVGRDSVLAKMAERSGATFVVADMPPEIYGTRFWKPLGIQGLLVRPLPPRDEVEPPVEQPARGRGIQAESLAKEGRP